MIEKLFYTFIIGFFSGLYFSNTRVAEELPLIGLISLGVLFVSVLGLIVTALIWVWR